MSLAGTPPNTTVVNFAKNAFALLHVPANAELVLPDGWEVTDVAPLDLLRKKACSQLNLNQAREALKDAAKFLV